MTRARSFVVALTLLTGASCASGRYATLQPQIANPNQQIAANVVPAAPGCSPGFHIFPSHQTINVNDEISLRDKWTRNYETFCLKFREAAKWNSNGGKLKVNHQGWEASFSSTMPGVYTVKAAWGTRTASSTITVMSP
jgi:hypothetical protein